ncbi:MAG: S-ribosylhomocysteine lyase [Clostridia bacterium]|nr:S-ribosylhomocysteine lyase [Clostridia bacterium]
MQKIRSFTVDHDKLTPGIYVSRTDGDVVTYDLRMRTPNAGDYLSDLAMHSFEHMLATYMRSGNDGDRVIYVGPMGCRTGFYLLMRGTTKDNKRNLDALKNALRGIIAHTGSMPGAHRRECGNFRCLSVLAARREAEKYLAVLEKNGDNISFSYDGEILDGGI